MEEKILILDFGSQYTQLIARRIRELNVYCEIAPFNCIPLVDRSIKAVILSGGPCSVLDREAPDIDFSILENLPILGICYGAQLMVKKCGGKLAKSANREYGRSHLAKTGNSAMFNSIPEAIQIWMSHADSIVELPSHFRKLASTHDIPVAAFEFPGKNWFGLQFHPEVTHTEKGSQILKNFVVGIAKARQKWTAERFVDMTVQSMKQKINNDKVIMGLSGGVDSSVASVLLQRAVGNNLHCIFVDNGLLRKNEFNSVLKSYVGLGLKVHGVDASQRFYKALCGVVDPEQKRKVIGKTFIEVFEEESKKIEDVKWLGQGTIYPDIIESVSIKGPSATIKSHHNVGGLPEVMQLQVVEPLKTLFKDGVRRVGRSLGLPKAILDRHPFPGPGLGIRIPGEVTQEKVKLLQEVDHIFIEELKLDGLYDEVWQAGTILLPVQSVGVMGDERTYENVVALRAVSSHDGMTADWCQLPHDFLGKISNKIINQVTGINRVVYDISSKPPSTIEWE